jgi:predicted nucleic acid-binding Zn ribbon protein
MGGMMVEDHKHCLVCGKPTDPDKNFCSTSCEELAKQQQKRASRSRLIMLILFIVMFAVIIILPMFTTSTKP